jgi:hypothetical protein
MKRLERKKILFRLPEENYEKAEKVAFFDIYMVVFPKQSATRMNPF